MRYMNLLQSVEGLIFTGSTLTVLLFVNLILKKAEGSILDINVPLESIHIFLGPVIVIINSLIFIFTCMLYFSKIDHQQIQEIQRHSPYVVGGFLFNPFFVSSYKLVNSIGTHS